MIEGMDSMELGQITMNGSRVMTQVNAALSSGSQNAQKAALVKIMDEEDGIVGNMQFETDKTTGIVRLVEYPSAEEMEAGTNGQAVINEFGTTKGWDGFTQGLEAEFTPLKSLEIAKTNAEIKKLNSEANYADGRIGADQKAADKLTWSKHTETELYRQIATMMPEELRKTYGVETLDEYKMDYMRRNSLGTNYAGYELLK
jgi:hypothetical protein